MLRNKLKEEIDRMEQEEVTVKVEEPTDWVIIDWKDARVIPSYKEGDRRILGNYRPISILPIVSKVFENEIFRQLYEQLNENKLISKFQSGFRPWYSTITTLIQMCDSWYENMDNGKLTGVVLIDIRKAFDFIGHDILLEKLPIMESHKLNTHGSNLILHIGSSSAKLMAFSLRKGK